MQNHGPIVIIEDDTDDQETLADALKDNGVKNPLLFFGNTRTAFDYLLKGEQPFLIICDVNLPAQNGIEFKKQIDNDPVLWKKSIPFIYLTTSAQPEVVRSAYHDLTVQGFFIKPSTMQAYRMLMKDIMAYWQNCQHPNG